MGFATCTFTLLLKRKQVIVIVFLYKIFSLYGFMQGLMSSQLVFCRLAPASLMYYKG